LLADFQVFIQQKGEKIIGKAKVLEENRLEGAFEGTAANIIGKFVGERMELNSI